MLNDYKQQAVFWDWDGYDDSSEYEYWRGYAELFGAKVLVPMCAHGKAGAYMAKNGLLVTAFDITPEMIEEGKKRYGAVNGLELIVADLLALDLEERQFDFAFIAGNGDLHLLQSIEDVRSAFLSLRKHMRAGGCLVLELILPSKESWSYPKRIFHPRVPNYTDKKIWKESENSYDANKKRHYINQTVYIEDESGVKTFVHSVCLQYYGRNEIINTLKECGFIINGEYCNRERKPWKADDEFLFIETIAK